MTDAKKIAALTALVSLVENAEATRKILEQLLIQRLHKKLPLGKRTVRYATIHYGTRTVEFGLVGTDGRERREHEDDFVSQLWHDLWFARSGDIDALKVVSDFIREGIPGLPTLPTFSGTQPPREVNCNPQPVVRGQLRGDTPVKATVRVERKAKDRWDVVFLDAEEACHQDDNEYMTEDEILAKFPWVFPPATSRKMRVVSATVTQGGRVIRRRKA